MVRLQAIPALFDADTAIVGANAAMGVVAPRFILDQALQQLGRLRDGDVAGKTLVASIARRSTARSEEHTSELQSLMRISYAVFCLKKKKNRETHETNEEVRKISKITNTHNVA